MVNKLTLKTIFDGKSGADTATPKPEDGNAFSATGTDTINTIISGAALDDGKSTSINAAAYQDGSNAAILAEKRQKEHAQESMYIQQMIMLMQDAKKLLDNLNNEIDQYEQELIAEYGPDYINVIHSLHFDDDQNLSLEEKIERLQGIYLDENGNIKDEYKDEPIADYLSAIYDRDRLRVAIQNNDLDTIEEIKAERPHGFIAQQEIHTNSRQEIEMLRQEQDEIENFNTESANATASFSFLTGPN